MKKLLIFFLLLQSKIFGNYIIHERIHEAPHNLPCWVEAYLNTTEEDIHRFSLLYRSKGSLEYLEAPMMLTGHLKYSSAIPGNFMARDLVEYYLLLELSDGKTVTFPQAHAIYSPIIIQIDLPSEKIIPITSSEIDNFDIVGLSSDIVIISPKPGERVKSQDLFIALSYFGEKDVDPTNVKVYIDWLDVSNRADIDSTYLSLSSEGITPGLHTVTVNISNKFGQKFDDISWSFTVLPGNVAGAGLIRKQSGRLWVNYTGGNVDNSAMNIGELNLQYAIDLDWLQSSSQYQKSSLENKFDQPYDRYAFDFKNNLMSIKLGDSYPHIDQFAMNGHHVRGVNFNFGIGPLSLDIIKGNTARVIQGNPVENAIEISEIDSTDLDNLVITLSRNNYTFQQELLAAKIGFRIGDKFYWDVNYIKVEDNIATVIKEIPNAEIIIVPELQSSMSSISYENLINLMDHDDYSILSPQVGSVAFPAENWLGSKPRDNLIYGSNMKVGFDDARMQVSSGFSVSYLNPNKWNNLQTIAALDTIAKNEGDILKILNMSNLNSYIKLKLRYLGNSVELGSLRNGPDYYSLLNPYLKTDYTEIFISDRVNLFQNKLLLYYKRSNITEGLYPEEKAQMDIQKTIFNISLYPGIGMPTFNIGFITSNYRDTTDIRIDLANTQSNISMTDHFNLGVPQTLNVSILLYDQEDFLIKESLNSENNLSKDVSSESYGISLKSIYNNYWESIVYYNASYYDYGQKSHVDYNKQNIRCFQLDMAFLPTRYVNRVDCSLQYSIGHDSRAMIQYNYKIGAESELVQNFTIRLNFDYRIKFLDTENKGTSDSFIRAYLNYNIL